MQFKLYLFAVPLLIFMLLPIRGFCAENIGYLSVLPDIPIYSGMKEDISQAIIFDKASGRVVDTVINGKNLDENRVIKFYFDSLIQLGWVNTKDNIFIRDKEQLIVKSIKNENGLTIKFSLIPKYK